MIQKWKRHSSEILADYYVFKALKHNVRSPITQKDHSFYTLEAKDWANVIAFTPDRKVVMVRQYRHGIDDVTLEFPAGGLEAEDRDIADLVMRELLEETGYSGNDITELGFVHPNPAFLNNKCYSFLIKDVQRMRGQSLDDTEDIEVVEVSIESIPEMIKSGKISHSLSVAAFCLYDMWAC